MHPKSHKEFKKGIAEDVGVHPQVVDDFITFYYANYHHAYYFVHVF